VSGPNGNGAGSPGAVSRLLRLGERCARDLWFDRARALSEVRSVPVEESLASVMEWLRRSHEITGRRGSAKSFSYLSGWRDAYPETTGYIAPTFFDYAEYTGEPGWREDARRMLDFLCEVQQPDGGILGGTVKRTRSQVSIIFNTGMVLAGFHRGALETGDERYIVARTRAADFLARVRSDPELWRAHSYHGLPHAYHARVAWHLLEASGSTGDAGHRAAALDVYEWVLEQQQPNGFFRNCTFTQERPVCNAHGLAYTLRGLLEGYRLERDERMLAAVQRGSRPVRERFLETGRLPGFFAEDWSPRPRGECLTGVAQFAIVWFDLFEHGAEREDLEAALRATDLLRALQDRTSPVVGIRGAVKGSHPVWGGYAPFQFPNWAAKFFADALLRRLRCAAPEVRQAPSETNGTAAEARNASFGARRTPVNVLRRAVFSPRVKGWAKRVDRRFALRPRLRHLDAALDRRTLSEDRLRELLGELGVVSGATVMVHCSMNDVGRRVPDMDALRLCRLLELLVGEDGTLLVPTFPFRGRQLDYVRSGPAPFNPRRTPSRMGLLTEVFRRLPGALRSLHPTHSVAARGPMAEELLGEHHLGTAFGERSPFYKLQACGGIVVGLGVDIHHGFTVLHVAEELEPRSHEHVFVDETYPMRIRRGDEELAYELRPMRPVFRNVTWLQRRLQERGAFRIVREGGLLLSSAAARAFIETQLEVLRETPSEYY